MNKLVEKIFGLQGFQEATQKMIGCLIEVGVNDIGVKGRTVTVSIQEIISSPQYKEAVANAGVFIRPENQHRYTNVYHTTCKR